MKIALSSVSSFPPEINLVLNTLTAGYVCVCVMLLDVILSALVRKTHISLCRLCMMTHDGMVDLIT
jgi:hypothetical protein